MTGKLVEILPCDLPTDHTTTWRTNKKPQKWAILLCYQLYRYS